MAQGTQPNQASTLWAESAARVGYAVHNGKPLIGVSADEGDGYLAPLDAPGWFSSIGDEGARDNVFRGMAAHALRVGQAGLKAADKPSREIAIASAHKALNGSYKPSRERGNDIVESEAERMFEKHVRGKVVAAKADATEDQIAATVAAQAETSGGKELMNKFRSEITERGTYAVSRRGKSGPKTAVEITL